MKPSFTLRRLVIFFLLLCGVFAATMHFIAKPHRKPKHLTLYGNVDVRQVDLGFRVYGRVSTMPFQEGDFVPQGTFMGAIDKQPYLDQVAEAEARCAAIQCALINDERNMKRREKIVGAGAVSDEEYQNALTQRNIDEANLKQAIATLGIAQTNLADTQFYAPNDGVILTRIREPGTVVNIGDPIYTLSLTTPIWIRAFVDEPSLGLVYPGMPAEITTDSGGTYKGHIGFISPVAEFTPKTVETTKLRTDLVFRLRVIADNADQGLRQGMPVTVKLPLPKRKKA